MTWRTEDPADGMDAKEEFEAFLVVLVSAAAVGNTFERCWRMKAPDEEDRNSPFFLVFSV